MTVVFDVLDNLNSIRNVEDLKKRWAEDSKRPQTLSWKAVSIFIDLFTDGIQTSSFILHLANFLLRYRDAVTLGKCPLEDQVWIMPYIRYAERLKTFITYGDSFDFEPDSFAIESQKEFATFSNGSKISISNAYNHVIQICDNLPNKEESTLSKQQWVKLFQLFYELSDYYWSFHIEDYFDENYWWFSNIVAPGCFYNDYLGRNPWDLNPDYDIDWLEEAYHIPEDIATVYPFFWLGYGPDVNEIRYSFENLYISDFKNTEKIYDAMESQFDLSVLIDKFRKDESVKNYFVFKKIIEIITNDSLSALDKLKRIQATCSNKLPENFEIRLRYVIESIFAIYLKELSPKIFTGEARPAEITKILDDVYKYSNILPDDLVKYLTKILNESLEIAVIRYEERQKVLFEMSHSIKNLLASVSEPLAMLLDGLSGTQRRTVENALAGAGLIRDLAVGVHMSMRGEVGAWRNDVKEPGFGATTLDKIILDAMRYAASNMFCGKYFASFVKNYFARNLDTFMQAQEEWKAAESAEDTFVCINKYFFDFKLDIHGAPLNIPIGDRDGTATKLLILFQELFLNAVKYSSFTEREKRFVKLDVDISSEKWSFKLVNSAMNHSNGKSSGIGLSVIKNFAELFEAKYNASFDKDVYTANIDFFLTK